MSADELVDAVSTSTTPGEHVNRRAAGVARVIDSKDADTGEAEVAGASDPDASHGRSTSLFEECSAGASYAVLIDVFLNHGDVTVTKAVRASDVAAVGADRRALLPLPRAVLSDVAGCDNLLRVVNLCLAGLNCMDAGMRFCNFPSRTPTTAQRVTINHVVERCRHMVSRLDSLPDSIRP